MATIAKSWIEANCATCECRRIFFLQGNWEFVCAVCGTKRTLEPNGILAA